LLLSQNGFGQAFFSEAAEPISRQGAQNPACLICYPTCNRCVRWSNTSTTSLVKQDFLHNPIKGQNKAICVCSLINLFPQRPYWRSMMVIATAHRYVLI
jgi:hypothetical protein